MSQKTAAVSIAVLFRSTPCKWVVETGGSGRNLFIAEGVLDGFEPSERNAWDIRDSFLSIRRNDRLKSFLDATGRFTHYANRESWSPDDFEGWQNVIRALSKTKPENWMKLVNESFRHVDHSRLAGKFEGSFRVNFGKRGKFYVGQIEVQTTLQAMIASVYIDWMAGVKMGFCERQECRKPYEVTSSHKRKYCTPECAHYEVVRRGRERNKAGRLKKGTEKSWTS